MFKRMNVIAAAALCGLVLSLSTAPRAHGAEANVLATGQAGNKLFVLVWVDTDKGIQLDGKAAKEVAKQYAGSDWSLLDDKQVVITKDNKELVRGVYVGPDDQSWANFHGHGQNAVANGGMFRFEDDPTQGFGTLTITEFSQDGRSSRSIWIETPLTFAEGG
jgi:hypothetical protein